MNLLAAAWAAFLRPDRLFLAFFLGLLGVLLLFCLSDGLETSFVVVGFGETCNESWGFSSSEEAPEIIEQNYVKLRI